MGDTVSVGPEYAVTLRWRKRGHEGCQRFASAGAKAEFLENLLEGWEPDAAWMEEVNRRLREDGAGEADLLRRGQDDYLEMEFSNGRKVRAGVRDGCRTWDPAP